jgi:hypothetical protein
MWDAFRAKLWLARVNNAVRTAGLMTRLSPDGEHLMVWSLAVLNPTVITFRIMRFNITPPVPKLQEALVQHDWTMREIVQVGKRR